MANNKSTEPVVNYYGLDIRKCSEVARDKAKSVTVQASSGILAPEFFTGGAVAAVVSAEPKIKVSAVAGPAADPTGTILESATAAINRDMVKAVSQCVKAAAVIAAFKDAPATSLPFPTIKRTTTAAATASATMQ